LPFLLIVSRLLTIEDVGFTPKETIISCPEDIPPSIPPALLVLNFIFPDLDLISWICISSILILFIIRSGLLAITVDPLAAAVQGIPVRSIGLLFSVVTAAVVVSMVQVVGALLVTSLLVTPAATAQLVGRSFRTCMIWTQIFGLSSVLLGLYFSAENDTGSGSMIALVAAIIFCLTAIITYIPNLLNYTNSKSFEE